MAAVEQAIGAGRRHPNCGTTKARSHRYAGGPQRYRCRSCARTFNAASCSPLSRVRRKDRWLQFCPSMAKVESLRGTTKYCGNATMVVFRWRHRFLQAVEQRPDKLHCIVEVDEIFTRGSQKGERNLKRPPRRRGGPAAQVPTVAADCGGQTRSRVIPNRIADSLIPGIGPWAGGDALLVTDSRRSYPLCTAALGPPARDGVNLSAGERVRGAVLIQTVNSRHRQRKDFLCPLPGVSTRYFDNYVRLFRLTKLTKQANGCSCLAAATNWPTTRNAICAPCHNSTLPKGAVT